MWVGSSAPVFNKQNLGTRAASKLSRGATVGCEGSAHKQAQRKCWAKSAPRNIGAAMKVEEDGLVVVAGWCDPVRRQHGAIVTPACVHAGKGHQQMVIGKPTRTGG
jgi:hypothetical protein